MLVTATLRVLPRELTIVWHDAWVESSRELTVATEKHVLPPQVHIERYYMPHPTPPPPHPTPPMRTKHHGLLKAVVQLSTYLSTYLSIYLSTYPSIYINIYIYIHTVRACMSWVWANKHISSNIHINIHESIWHLVAQFKTQRSL